MSEDDIIIIPIEDLTDDQLKRLTPNVSVKLKDATINQLSKARNNSVEALSWAESEFAKDEQKKKINLARSIIKSDIEAIDSEVARRHKIANRKASDASSD